MENIELNGEFEKVAVDLVPGGEPGAECYIWIGSADRHEFIDTLPFEACVALRDALTKAIRYSRRPVSPSGE